MIVLRLQLDHLGDSACSPILSAMTDGEIEKHHDLDEQSTGEEEEFGYGGGRPAPSAPQGQWGGRRYESYDAFEVRLAQGRARRARSLAQLRKHLHAPNGTALRYGLVGFYRAGDEAALKDRLKFPYPFAGWSLGREGSGFWCELHIASYSTLRRWPWRWPAPG